MGSPRARKKILVVDDDPAVRKMLTLLLESTGEVLLASTGEEALVIMASQRPRLVVLDMNMPGIGGLEVLQAAKNGAAVMSIIVLTGINDLKLAKRALELGACEYVTKPFDLPRLKEKIEASLESVSEKTEKNRGLPWRIVSPEQSQRKT